MPIHGYPGNIITANPTAPTVSAASGVWTTEQQLQAVSQGNWPGYEYPISRSLRFNSADSAYLNRTPASAGNRKTWTWSGWVKRSALSSTQYLMSQAASSGLVNDGFQFSSTDTLQFLWNYQGAGGATATSAVFRDASAWYHIVVKWDTTQATSANRIIFYVNGVQQTQTGTYPSQNYDGYINTAAATDIGRLNATNYFSGYLTEINFIDGQALTPSSFGLNDPETGIWSPKQYTGTYGTNGFYLNFSDNSNTTSTTLGKDSSGNGNNWTPNNFSVTAGAGNDSLVDTPTSYGTDTGVGGEVRGNYCTLSPVELLNDATYGTSTYRATLSNGNLEASYPSNFAWAVGTMPIYSSGCKFYWEISPTITTSSNGWVGCSILGGATSSVNYTNGGEILLNSNLQYTVSTYTTGDVIGITIDTDANQVKFYKNNVLQGGAVDVSAYSNDPNTMFWPSVWVRNSGDSYICNFGQRAYTYTAPSGFKALCTQNLPTPTIGATSTTQANDYMNVVLYTGNGAARSITGLDFQPDFVWIKSRSNATWNALHDAVRGSTKELFSNSSDQELTNADSVTSFNSNGFSLGADTAGGNVNVNNYTYVSWNWKANGAGGSNTAGTITSTVSANTTSGFSIVTYTGTGVAATVGHGLGVAPNMVIVKRRNAAVEWPVYHVSVGNNKYLYLNTTAAAATFAMWNNTTPTSTVFSIGVASDNNANTGTYVAYCFAAVAGYSAFGSYTGNASADGPFIYTGFRPRFVLIKRTDTTANWRILDTARDTYNVEQYELYPNLSNAEGTFASLDGLSNGFKIRNSDTAYNASGGTYVYAAFAESPFKYALAR